MFLCMVAETVPRNDLPTVWKLDLSDEKLADRDARTEHDTNADFDQLVDDEGLDVVQGTGLAWKFRKRDDSLMRCKGVSVSK